MKLHYATFNVQLRLSTFKCVMWDLYT